LAALAVVPLLILEGLEVVPDGEAGVRVSQFWGVRPGTLYPGVHVITPFVDSVAWYDTREQVYLTLAAQQAGWRLPNRDKDSLSATGVLRMTIWPGKAG